MRVADQFIDTFRARNTGVRGHSISILVSEVASR